MINVIINADDFGMSEGYNYGVIKSYRDGVVSSTSLIVNLPTSEHAALLSRDYPELFIGLHVNFVLGKPCSDPAKIPSMLDHNGNFYRSREYRSGKKQFCYEEVRIETIAQIERFKEIIGYYPEHIEGHAVTSEIIVQVFLDIAKEFGIHTSIFGETNDKRNVLKGYKEVVPIFSPKYNEIINEGVCVENFLNDDFGILKENKEKVIELHFHPGYLDQFILDNSSLTLPRCKDLSTLCDSRVKEWLKQNQINLISFRDLKL